MSVFPIPDDGLLLESSANARGSLPAQAFGITLDDDAIEDMIKCVQSGGEIELTLGRDPSFIYGSEIQSVALDPHFDYDLFCTNIDDSSRKTERYPNPAMSILQPPPDYLTQGTKGLKAGKYTSSTSSSGPESERGPNGRLKPTGNGTKKAPSSLQSQSGKGAISSVFGNKPRASLPPSPALPGAASPNPAISASEKLRQKNIEQRTILVHELAVCDQSLEHLENAWMGLEKDFKPTLEKVAALDQATQKWKLSKPYWKELDVWKHHYHTEEERQSAIDNAIKQFDKQRMSATSPEWEKLLRVEDRGKGIVLSKLQDKIAKTNLAPTSKAGKGADEAGKSDAESSKGKGENMTRTGSQQSVTKPKKPTDQEKRLFSNKTKKPTPVTKPHPVAKPKAADDRRVLSSEIAIDSSDSDDAAPLITAPGAKKPKPAELPSKPAVEKPVQKPAPKPATKPVQKPKVSAAPAPKPKPVVRAPRPHSSTNTPTAPAPAPVPAKKRAREDDDSSSSGGTPLLKRLKPPKEPLPPKPVANSNGLKSRPGDAGQTARNSSHSNGHSNLSAKTKNTSPVKSSPLASSPPTNVSDMDDSSQSQRSIQRGYTNGSANGVTASINKKRKIIESSGSTVVGKKKPKVSNEILKRASAFTRFYEKYELLHREVSALKDPPHDKVADLLELRERLVTMKTEISRQVEASA